MLVTGLFNIYAVLFGLFGGLLAEIVNRGRSGFWVGCQMRRAPSCGARR